MCVFEEVIIPGRNWSSKVDVPSTEQGCAIQTIDVGQGCIGTVVAVLAALL